MFSSLLPKWQRLAAPLANFPRRSLRWLDVGCGTGLVGANLAVLLGSRISQGVLVDPSHAMVAECEKRAREWPFETRFLAGTIADLPESSSYDLVTVNSVLHHVVELRAFCRRLADLVGSGGYLITCHDMAGEFLLDLMLRGKRMKRSLSVQSIRNRLAGWLPRPLVSRLKRLTKLWPGSGRRQGEPPVDWQAEVLEANSATAVVDATNRRLLENATIAVPLSAMEIWAVTDFQNPGQPGNFGKGIRLDFLKACVRPLRLDDYFTYEFRDYPRSQFGSRWRRASR